MKRGFTIIEMVIVLSIFAIIASVVMFNMRGFSNKVSLDNLAQDIALAIRNAQVEAVSGRYVGVEFASAPSYGVHFDFPSESFIHFADFNNNKIYDDGIPCGEFGSECLEIITLQSGYTIQCAEATVLATGSPIPCTGPIDSYDITFTRPESYPSNTGRLGASLEVFSDTGIVIIGPDLETARIRLWPTGQIDVE